MFMGLGYQRKRTFKSQTHGAKIFTPNVEDIMKRSHLNRSELLKQIFLCCSVSISDIHYILFLKGLVKYY